MRLLASSKGGKCLSSVYQTARDKLKWECAKGHSWIATPDNVRRGHWCPTCTGRGKTIDDMGRLAESKGGMCLSKEYKDSQKSKLKWQCANGHIWEATSYGIEKGNWCPYCKTEKRVIKIKLLPHRDAVNERFIEQSIKVPRRYRIEDFQELAASKGGRCLSDRYVTSAAKLTWQCDKGHIWDAIPGSVKAGSWCPYCVGYDKRKKWTIQDMQEIASQRGGRCLSIKYNSVDNILEWQCKEMHTWRSTPYHIINGTWCPICSEGISERICRKHFEIIFDDKFPKVRPSWLRGKKGWKLELDGFSQKLGIAFEFQGRQHYKYIEWFHKNRALREQQEVDELKKRLCQHNNIVLIDVPYSVDYEHMAEYIVKECNNQGIRIPKITSKINYKLFDVYCPEKLKECQQIADSRGWKCLSEKYIRSNSKLKWQCDKGHRWEAHISNIKTGRACPYCSHKAKPAIEELKQLAASRGGKCLSTEYVNCDTKLEWMCKEGHAWESSTHNVKMKGRWCPVCGGSLKLRIQDMQKEAEKHGGKCLSSEYVNAGTKLEWKCNKGHTWWAIPNNIRRGHWCPTCARNKGKCSKVY